MLIGAEGNDARKGQVGDDDLTGDDGDDRLSGGRGVDALYGGAGKDVLTGGEGADLFRFSTGDTAADPKFADRVTDFAQFQHDRIDLTDYDANPGTKGTTDPFTFVGTSAFSGTVGELRYEVSGSDTLVSGDTNGDKTADFTIRLTGKITLTTADFLFAAPVTPAHAFAHSDLTANRMLHLV